MDLEADQLQRAIAEATLITCRVAVAARKIAVREG